MNLSKSLRRLADLRPGEHLCFLFETDEEYRFVLTRFLRQGLERGEKVMSVVNNRSAETILNYLREDGLKPGPFLARRQLVFPDAGEVFLVEGKFDPAKAIGFLRTETQKALVDGFAALRITGEVPQAGDTQSHIQRLKEYETAVNEFLRDGKCLPLCQYDRQRLDPALLLEILTVHPFILMGVDVLENFYFQPQEVVPGAADPAAAQLSRCLQNLKTHAAQVKQAHEQLVGETEKRRQIEERLWESEAHFWGFMRHLPGGVVIRDLQGRYLFANEGWEKAFGIERNGWQGKTLEDIWPADLARQMREGDQQVIATRQPVETVMLFEQEDGPRAWLIKRFPILGKDGQPVMVGVAGLDITDRRAAEEALYQEKEKYQTLVEKSPLGIALITKEGRYAYVNPKFVEIFGYTLEEIPTGREWFAKAYPDRAYRQEVVADWQEEVKALRTGEIRPRTFRVTCKDGTVKVINFRSAVLPNGDWMMFYEDISERVQAQEALAASEKQYRLLVSQIPAVVFKGYADGRVAFFDRKIEAMTGYPKEDFDSGRLKWTDLILPEDAPAVKESLRKALKSDRSYVREYRIRKQDGDIMWIQGRGHISCDAAGRIDHISGVFFDISERRRAEEALRQSEIKYRNLVEQIPAVTYIATFDDTSTTLYISPQIESLIGFSPSDYEADPNTWNKQLHPDDRERVLAEVAGCHATGEPLVSEYRMLNRDGLVVWVRDEARVVRDINGQPLFLQGVMLDITERKELEEALRKREAEYRLLVNQIPAVVFRGHADWSISCFDRKIEDLTGYAKEDFDERRLKWSDLIPAEEMEYVKRTFIEALKTTKSYVREHRIRKKNGDYAWVQCRGRIFCDPAGNVEYISGVTFDITKHKEAEAALRESERRYRLLAENVSDVIWTADLNLGLTYVSPSIKLLRGFTPEEVLGQRLEEIFTPESLKLAYEAYAEGMALEKWSPQPGRSWTLDLEQFRKDGSTVWTEVRASFLRDDSGRPVGILGITRDISKRKEVEEALRRRDAVLEAVSFAAAKFMQAASWTEDIQEIMARLGQAIQSSRVYLFENHWRDDGALCCSQRYEWAAPGVTPQIGNPDLQNIPYQASGFGRWQDTFSRGGLIFGHVREFPRSEQQLLEPQDIKSIIAVPIFADQEWWGFIGFDECHWERTWTACEIEALKAAASTLGAAIQHQRADKALRESEEKLRSLANQLLGAQENERKRLAAELHDELGHSLLTMKLRLNSLEKQLPPEQQSLKKLIKQILKEMGHTIENVRRLYLDLSPGDLEDLGLTGALRAMIEDFTELNPQVALTAKFENLDALFPASVQTPIYRIMQEALTNIGKHAKAKRISLAIARENQKVSFTIEDDGRGFDRDEVLATKKTLGLLAMEERVKILGGSFDLWSRKKQGTRISFTIPVPGARGELETV